MATQTPAQNQESWSEFARPRRFIPVAEPEKVSSTTLPSNPKINDLWVDPQGVRWRYISSSGFNRSFSSGSEVTPMVTIASHEETELAAAQRRIAELEHENATLRSENVALKIELSIRKSFHTDLEIEIQAAEAEMLWLNNLSSRAKKSP